MLKGLAEDRIFFSNRNCLNYLMEGKFKGNENYSALKYIEDDGKINKEKLLEELIKGADVGWGNSGKEEKVIKVTEAYKFLMSTDKFLPYKEGDLAKIREKHGFIEGNSLIDAAYELGLEYITADLEERFRKLKQEGKIDFPPEVRGKG